MLCAEDNTSISSLNNILSLFNSLIMDSGELNRFSGQFGRNSMRLPPLRGQSRYERQNLRNVPTDAFGNQLPIHIFREYAPLLSTKRLLEDDFSSLASRPGYRRPYGFPNSVYPGFEAMNGKESSNLAPFNPQLRPLTRAHLPAILSDGKYGAKFGSQYPLAPPPVSAVSAPRHSWSQWELSTLHMFVPAHNWTGAQARMPHLSYSEIREMGEKIARERDFENSIVEDLHY